MQRKNNRRKRKRRGFTLTELMLVLVIISIIGGFGIMAILQARTNAFVEIAKGRIKEFDGPLKQYALHNNDYPTTEDGLEALYQAPSSLSDSTTWRGPYIEDPPANDPWGQPYQYEFPGSQSETKYDLWSMGPDQISGTEDDICSWNMD